jgi:creatinine amidohydrolase/Fe(II)-dependent formamide hydrolase-like protein
MEIKRRKLAGKVPKNLIRAAWCRLEDFDKLDREKTLCILPVSSLEVHGYHLPNDTDMTSAEVMAEETGAVFARNHGDWTVVLMPLLNIGTDELPLPGSIEFSRKTVYRALKEYAWSLWRFGFRNLVLTNGHGGLMHNLALDDACRTCYRKYKMRMISPGIRVYQDFIFGKKFPLIEQELGRKLTDREKTGLTDLEHAGGWETSIILAESPSLVSGDFRNYTSSRLKMGERTKKWARILEPIARRLPVLGGVLKVLGLPLEEGFRILQTADKMYDQKKERYTYSGDPSVAKAEIGRAWKAAMAGEINRLAEKVYITGEARPSEIVSNYSTILVLRRDFMVALSLVIIILLGCAVLSVCYKTGILGG